MTTVKKTTGEKGFGNAVLSSDVKKHANDPFFLKKAAEAREAVTKIVLPESKKN